jgi:hypothetical protein
LFFSLFSISAYVWPSYSKHESQPCTSLAHSCPSYVPLSSMKIANLPNTVLPRLSTNLPSVRPWNNTGSCPGPSQYPNVHTAWADLSSKPESILCRLGAPRESMNHLLSNTLARWVLGMLMLPRSYERTCNGSYKFGFRSERTDSHVRSRQVVHSFEAQTCVFD